MLPAPALARKNRKSHASSSSPEVNIFIKDAGISWGRNTSPLTNKLKGWFSIGFQSLKKKKLNIVHQSKHRILRATEGLMLTQKTPSLNISLYKNPKDSSCNKILIKR